MSQNQKKDSATPLGKSTDDSGHENYGNELNVPIALKAYVQMIEVREESLEMNLQESQNEFASLEEKYQKENVKLKLEQMNQQKIDEAENEFMVPIREMKVQLPLENWHDLLAFVPRSQLGNVVSQIGHRQFAKIIQSFLHDETRKITLRKIGIIPPRSLWTVYSYQPMVQVWPEVPTNMPDWPMPANIKNFEEIELDYVDTSVLNLLGYFQENSLLENVNLCVDLEHKENILVQVLHRIVPLISSIDSIFIFSLYIDLFKMVYDSNYTNHGNRHESQVLLKEMMAKTRIVLNRWYFSNSDSVDDFGVEKMDCYCSWLYTPRDDGKPRMLTSCDRFRERDCVFFIERIKKDFKMAINPACFIIYTCTNQDVNVEEISVENVKTNEKLVIKTKLASNWKKNLLISRHPLKAAKNWIEANEKEITEWKWNTEKLHRKIKMDSDLAIAM